MVRSVRFAPHAFALLAQPFLHILNFFASNANLRVVSPQITGYGILPPRTHHPLARPAVGTQFSLLRHGHTICLFHPLLNFCGLVRCNSLRFLLKSIKHLQFMELRYSTPKVANFALLMESKIFRLRTFCSSTTRPKCHRTLCSVLNSGELIRCSNLTPQSFTGRWTITTLSPKNFQN